MSSFVLSRSNQVIRDWWRGWRECDLQMLDARINNRALYSNGDMVRISKREFRALPELNRRVMSRKQDALLYPVLLWIDGIGLRYDRRAE